ncbi:ATP-binding protein [Massilia sp. 9096]|uniref:hybrid sensor histidine kinase/response regulator n=1 Tax=Massilia sp. 9096 TaxID=1500894 RepID=UPI00068E8875|nr:ATP-binding protein [Massilia sp. 9096]
MRIDALFPAGAGAGDTGNGPARACLDIHTENALDELLRLAVQVLAVPRAMVDLGRLGRRWWPAPHGVGDAAAAAVEAQSLDRLLALARTGEGVSEGVVTAQAGEPWCVCAPLAHAGGPVRGVLAVFDDAGEIGVDAPAPARNVDAAWRFALRTLAGQGAARLELLASEREAAALRDALAGAQAQLQERASDLQLQGRRTADVAARDWRRRLEAILEAGDVGTWSWELDSGRVLADDNVARLYGIPEELARAGAPVAAYIDPVHPDDAAHVRASLDATVTRGEALQVVHRVRRPDGSEVTVNVRGRLECGDDGAPVRVSGVVLDVTRQAETERQLRSSESARLQGEQRYRTVLNAVDVGFCVIQMIFDERGEPIDHRILETNPAFAQHTGLHNAAGKRIRELVGEHDIRWSRIYGRVARIGLPVRVVQHSANLGRWLDVYAARIGDPAHFNVAVFLRDVTEERQRSDTLQRLADDLADANRRQSEFLATLAHELRNPLAPVRTGLDLLRIGADKPSVLAKVRPMMERQVSHLVNLVDDLLDLARINSGKVELKKADVVLKDVILRAVEMTLPAIEAKRHDFQLELHDENTHLFADPTRLAQVVGNLLTNAAKYTMEGGRIRLEVRKVADPVRGERVRIGVIDSGIGIPAESLPRIFDMFTQVGRHPEQEAGGLGIGLHLVRQMTERHGGSVSADSAGPGQGSRFVVELPVAAHGRAGEDGAVPGPGGAGARRLRILLADDNQDALELLREVLEMEGHTVQAAVNGLMALEAAAWFAPDIAFLDIGMPGLNGYEVARRLRALPAGREAVLVAVTGWGTDEDRVKSSAAGFDFHLTKPVDLHSLMELIGARARA